MHLSLRSQTTLLAKKLPSQFDEVTIRITAAQRRRSACDITRLRSDIDNLISAEAREYPQSFHKQKPLSLF